MKIAIQPTLQLRDEHVTYMGTTFHSWFSGYNSTSPKYSFSHTTGNISTKSFCNT